MTSFLINSEFIHTTCTQVPRSPPVCASCTRDPRWAIATSAGPSLSPSPGRVLCRGSACVHTRPLALLRSAPCPQSRGGGGDGGGVCGLWTGRDLCHGPCLWTWGRLTGWSCSGLCLGLMELSLGLRVVETLKIAMILSNNKTSFKNNVHTELDDPSESFRYT